MEGDWRLFCVLHRTQVRFCAWADSLGYYNHSSGLPCEEGKLVLRLLCFFYETGFL